MSGEEAQRLGSIVLYPRGYDVDASLAWGVDAEGAERRVRLNVPGLIKKQVATGNGDLPSVASLADTGRRARNPCVADPNNQAVQPRGILLCERCVAGPNGTDDIEAGWMSVLRSDEQDPLPHFGIGHLDVQAWPNDKAPPAPGMEGTPPSGRALRHGERYQVSAVLLMRHRARVVGMADFAEGGSVRRFLAAASVEGRYGGMILRPVFRGQYLRDKCSSVWVRYDSKSGLFTSPEQALREAGDRDGERLRKMLRNPEVELHALPAVRVAAGPLTTAAISQGLMAPSPSKPEKVWLDAAWHHAPLLDAWRHRPFLATPVALRCVRTRDGRSELLSNLHAMGPPIGDAMGIGMEAWTRPNAPAQQQQQGGPSP